METAPLATPETVFLLELVLPALIRPFLMETDPVPTALIARLAITPTEIVQLVMLAIKSATPPTSVRPAQLTHSQLVVVLPANPVHVLLVMPPMVPV